MKKPFNQHSQLPDYWIKCPFCGEDLKKSGECYKRRESDYLAVSLYALGVFLIVLALFTLLGCGWPEPRFERITATKAKSDVIVANWQKLSPLNVVNYCTGVSMMPYIDCPHSILLQEIYIGQKLEIGMVVVFDRGDHPRVQHTIADLNETHVYMSGDNNRYSDGWFPKSNIKLILRKVVLIQN